MRSQQISPDIVVLEENLKGQDFAIGDTHGSLDALEKTLLKLDPEDRLFIAGDLADRGPHSQEIYDRIIQINKDREDQGLSKQIYVVEGNHENMLVEYVIAQEQLSSANEYDITPEKRDEYMNEFELRRSHIISKNIGGKWIDDLNDKNPAKLAEIASFAQSLPTIIHVKGKKPFNVVHASLPFSYKELLTRINKNNLMLSESEKIYSMWARAVGGEITIIPFEASPWDAITYCGHTICGGVREQGNYVNLDIGTYFSHHTCLVAHNSQQCDIVNAEVPLDDSATDDERLRFNYIMTRNLSASIKIANQIKLFFSNIELRRVSTAKPSYLSGKL